MGLVGRQQQAQSAQRSTDFSGPHLREMNIGPSTWMAKTLQSSLEKMDGVRSFRNQLRLRLNWGFGELRFLGRTAFCPSATGLNIPNDHQLELVTWRFGRTGEAKPLLAALKRRSAHIPSASRNLALTSGNEELPAHRLQGNGARQFSEPLGTQRILA